MTAFESTSIQFSLVQIECEPFPHSPSDIKWIDTKIHHVYNELPLEHVHIHTVPTRTFYCFHWLNDDNVWMLCQFIYLSILTCSRLFLFFSFAIVCHSLHCHMFTFIFGVDIEPQITTKTNEEPTKETILNAF